MKTRTFPAAAATLALIAFFLSAPAPLAQDRPAAPRPGEAVAFSWRVEGVAWNLRSLCLELVGVVPSPDQNGHRETIRYDEVLRETLFETTDSRRAARGEGSFTIPAALPDGIDPLSVDWTLVATGEVSGGPSLRDELPVPVQPADPAAPALHADSADGAKEATP